MRWRKLALASIVAAVMAPGTATQAADYSQTYLDQGVLFQLTEVGGIGSFNFTLGVNTTGYTGGAGVFMSNVDIKVTNSGGSFVSWTGPGTWADAAGSGPVSNSGVSDDGCGSGMGGFICVKETGTNDAVAGVGGIYSFSFTASGTLIPTSDWHVGARFADAGNVKIGDLVSTRTPVPEPEIYALMAVGLGLMGWVGRKKKLKEASFT